MEKISKYVLNVAKSINGEICESIKISYWLGLEQFVMNCYNDIKKQLSLELEGKETELFISYSASLKVVECIFNELIQKDNSFIGSKKLFLCFTSFFLKNNDFKHAFFKNMLKHLNKIFEHALLSDNINLLEIVNEYLLDFTSNLITQILDINSSSNIKLLCYYDLYVTDYCKGLNISTIDKSFDENIEVKLIDLINNSSLININLKESIVKESIPFLLKSLCTKIINFNYKIFLNLIVNNQINLDFLNLFNGLEDINIFNNYWRDIFFYLINSIVYENDFKSLNELISFAYNYNNNMQIDKLVQNNFYKERINIISETINDYLIGNLNRKLTEITDFYREYNLNTKRNGLIEGNEIKNILNAKLLIKNLLSSYFKIFTMRIDYENSLLKFISQENFKISKSNEYQVVLLYLFKNIISISNSLKFISSYVLETMDINNNFIIEIINIIKRMNELADNFDCEINGNNTNNVNINKKVNISNVMKNLDNIFYCCILKCFDSFTDINKFEDILNYFRSFYEKRMKSKNDNIDLILNCKIVALLVNKIINVSSLSKKIILFDDTYFKFQYKLNTNSHDNDDSKKSKTIKKSVIERLNRIQNANKNSEVDNQNNNHINKTLDVKYKSGWHNYITCLLKCLSQCFQLDRNSDFIIIDIDALMFVSDSIINIHFENFSLGLKDFYVKNIVLLINEITLKTINMDNSIKFSLDNSIKLDDIKKVICSTANNICKTIFPEISSEAKGDKREEWNLNGMLRIKKQEVFNFNEITQTQVFYYMCINNITNITLYVKNLKEKNCSNLSICSELETFVSISFKYLIGFTQYEPSYNLIKKLLIGLLNTCIAKSNDKTDLLSESLKNLVLKTFVEMSLIGDTAKVFFEYFKITEDLMMKNSSLTDSILKSYVYMITLSSNFFDFSWFHSFLKNKFDESKNKILDSSFSNVLEKSKELNQDFILHLTYNSIVMKTIFVNYEENTMTNDVFDYLLDSFGKYDFLKILENIKKVVLTISSKNKDFFNISKNVFNDISALYKNISSLFSAITNYYINSNRIEIFDSKKHESEKFKIIIKICEYLNENILNNEDVMKNEFTCKLSKILLNEFFTFENNYEFLIHNYSEEQAINYIQIHKLEFSEIRNLTQKYSSLKISKYIKFLKENGESFCDVLSCINSINTIFNLESKQINRMKNFQEISKGESLKKEINDIVTSGILKLPEDLYSNYLKQNVINNSIDEFFITQFLTSLFCNRSKLKDNIEVFELFLFEGILSYNRIIQLSDYIDMNILIYGLYLIFKKCTKNVQDLMILTYEPTNNIDVSMGKYTNNIINRYYWSLNQSASKFDSSKISIFSSDNINDNVNNSFIIKNSNIQNFIKDPKEIENPLDSLNNKLYKYFVLNERCNDDKSTSNMVLEQISTDEFINNTPNNNQFQFLNILHYNLYLIANYFKLINNLVSDKDSSQIVFESIIRILSDESTDYLDLYTGVKNLFRMIETKTNSGDDLHKKIYKSLYFSQIHCTNKFSDIILKVIKKIVNYSSYSNLSLELINKIFKNLYLNSLKNKHNFFFIVFEKTLNYIDSETFKNKNIKKGFVNEIFSILMNYFGCLLNIKGLGEQNEILKSNIINKHNDSNDNNYSVGIFDMLDIIFILKGKFKEKNSFLNDNKYNDILLKSSNMFYINLFIKSSKTVMNPKTLDNIVRIILDVTTENNKQNNDNNSSLIKENLNINKKEYDSVNTISKLLISMLYAEYEFCDDFIKILINNINHGVISKENLNFEMNEILNNLIDYYLAYNLLKTNKKQDFVEDYIINNQHLYLLNDKYFNFIIRSCEGLFEY